MDMKGLTKRQTDILRPKRLNDNFLHYPIRGRKFKKNEEMGVEGKAREKR